MRAEAVSWDDWSTSNAPPIAEDDKWHVALAPGEVKIVSLEQLDDLYRLSIVDAETKVWQTGMGEWQPLRVIAGIDDESAPPPAPKRTHPKPPSPRSAPPPPRPMSLAPVTSAALAATVPASFYPAAISVAPAPISFAAPIAPLQLNSVRPLVVSRAPVAPRRSSGLGRFLVGLALVAGVGISLYRNEVIRDAAHSAHQDALYARLEAALGGPAFGTLRSVDQGTSAASTPLANEDVTSPAQRTGEASVAPVPSPLPAALATKPSQPTGSTPPVVSLESLAPEKKALAIAAPAAPAAVMPVAIRSLAAPPSVAQPPAATPVKSAPAPKVEKPAPVPEKSEAQMTEREKLNAAISRSMLSAPPSSKSKSKASEYDPLNPKL
jgi:hypothetical protein